MPQSSHEIPDWRIMEGKEGQAMMINSNCRLKPHTLFSVTIGFCSAEVAHDADAIVLPAAYQTPKTACLFGLSKPFLILNAQILSSVLRADTVLFRIIILSSWGGSAAWILL
ncbi:hypothetical protein MPTK1_2g17880 [Marchantia polymorpha subsp. ruderalis]|uniref:Uncharacterized protein n=1 Tax=Marchantia polymorpha TaxID=3197 RepID=A0A2R6WGB5_MARPO|nr:hypothetical protein MARPO_0094s0057 [Marchantia polymorpha]BBN02757.1 hypothetical protein Mp_2g17880 [Marchantia polymorpha subsp. ruderalis]|eukprot:PTQ32884.1 hypothetical protein MARPO_0094s0057 [Marchantia polymorpha]